MSKCERVPRAASPQNICFKIIMQHLKCSHFYVIYTFSQINRNVNSYHNIQVVSYTAHIELCEGAKSESSFKSRDCTISYKVPENQLLHRLRTETFSITFGSSRVVRATTVYM